MKLKNTDEKINKKPIYKNIIGVGVSAMLGIFALTGCDNTGFEDNTSDGIAQNVDVNIANPEEQESPEFSAEIDLANFEIVPEWSVEEKMALAEKWLAAAKEEFPGLIVKYIGDFEGLYFDDEYAKFNESATPYKCSLLYYEDRNGDGIVDTDKVSNARITYSDLDKWQD